MKNAIIADKATDKIREIGGVYAHHISRMAKKIEHKKRANTIDVTLSFDAGQLGSDGDCRCIDPQHEKHDMLKMIPIIVFVDPNEF